MLVLSRKHGETIVLLCPGDIRIEVVIAEVSPGHHGHPQARLGITAPPEVTVLRKELEERGDKP